MLQYKKMDSHVIIYFIKSFHLIFSSNFLFSNFKTSLNLLNKSIIIIFNIALFKYNRSDLMLRSQLLIVTFLGINIFSSLLRCIPSFRSCILAILTIQFIVLFIISHIKYPYSIILVYIFSSPFCICEMLMRFANILF